MRRAAWLLLLAACGPEGPGPVATVVLLNRDLTGTVHDTLEVAVRVLDAGDGLLPGVTLTATTAQGALLTPEATSDAEGVARFTWVLDTVAGPQALTLSAGAFQQDLTIPALPGPAVNGGFTTAIMVVAGAQAYDLPIDARDQWGNAVPNPVLRSSEPVQANPVVGGRWTANLVGRVRFFYDLPGSDTLDVYVHPPLGTYRAEFVRFPDTVYVETGRLVVSTADPAGLCDVPADGVAPRVFDAVDVRRIRRRPGWADTLQVPSRTGVMVHAPAPSLDRDGNRHVFFEPYGIARSGACAGALFAYAWRFGLVPNFADSLTISPL